MVNTRGASAVTEVVLHTIKGYNMLLRGSQLFCGSRVPSALELRTRKRGSLGPTFSSWPGACTQGDWRLLLSQ